MCEAKPFGATLIAAPVATSMLQAVGTQEALERLSCCTTVHTGAWEASCVVA